MNARILALAGLLALAVAAHAQTPADTAAVVRFTLACAHCHEGECSGRLTFSSGPEAARRHILRYAGAVDPATADRLYALLEHMKGRCAYPPLPGPDPGRQPWGSADLDPFRDPASGGYFVPLGHLDVGAYRVRLALTNPAPLRVEVINTRFEPLMDRCMGADGTAHEIRVMVVHPATHYLRLRSPEGVLVERLAVDPG